MATLEGGEANPKKIVRALLGAGLGGGALGIATGIIIGVLLVRGAEESPLPLRTFDWILDHGINGVLLVSNFLLGWQYLRERKKCERERNQALEDRLKERQDAFDDRIKLEREYRNKVESLVREQVTITDRTGRTLEHNTFVLQSLHLIEPEGDEEERPPEKGATS